ncbi:MAG TPA: VOC family protein [Flavobacteriales bacterium]|nr:VOC family protein [Flavobacteriales bacterium]
MKPRTMISMPTVTPIPPGYHSLSPFLMVSNVDGLLEFLRNAFDAQIIRRLPGPDGSTGHAEVRMGDSHLMLGDPMGQHPARPGMLYFYVPKVDEVYKQALQAGGTSISPPTDMFYGDRNAGVKDAWDNIWWIATHVEDVSEIEMERRNAEEMKKRASAGAIGSRSAS